MVRQRDKIDKKAVDQINQFVILLSVII